MPAKQIHPQSRPKSSILLFVLVLFVLCLLFFLFSLSSSSSSSSSFSLTPVTYSNLEVEPETSFVASLENFLTRKVPKRSSPVRDDTVLTFREEDVERFDYLKYRSERNWLHRDPSYPVNFSIRVYVYDMPSKFTYNLLWLFRNTYKENSNLTSNGSPVHRLIQQHSIDYWIWADLIAPESERVLKNVVRVHQQEEADLFYVPFFTTISFFLLEKQECKALYRVKL